MAVFLLGFLSNFNTDTCASKLTPKVRFGYGDHLSIMTALSFSHLKKKISGAREGGLKEERSGG